MGFFWKFTRSGCYSRTYVSLIIDVVPDSMDLQRQIWHASFEELGNAMILLHDVEVLNQPTVGTTKPAFRNVVVGLGYEPTLQYRALRNQFGLVCGQASMGRYDGNGLDWGWCPTGSTPIDVNIAGFQYAKYVEATTGRICGWRGDTEDKLSCYRQHSAFAPIGTYYDLMPKHTVMDPIIRAMKAKDSSRTEAFIGNCLKWTTP